MGEMRMMMKRLLVACMGAAAMVGVASAPTFAATARDDPTQGRFETVSGSTLVLRIPRDLLRNDKKRRGERIVFDGFNDHFPGIVNIARRGNRLFIEIAENFVGNTKFRYRIEGIRRHRSTGISKAYVKIRVFSDA
jgi:hypothetical protein